MSETEQIKDALLKKSDKPKDSLRGKRLVGFGSTLLNLICTGRAFGGIPEGIIVLFVGDSDSGKSLTAMHILAEAANSEKFDEYDLVYNDAEGGAIREVGELFGSKLEQRIEFVDNCQYSDDFYDDVLTRLKSSTPFIYILDSESVLEARVEDEKFDANRKRRKKGQQEKGDFGMAKAKMNSQNLRKIRARIKKHGSILVIIAQTRDMVATVGFGEKKTRPGGRALKFYSALEVWTAFEGDITKKVGNKERQIGIKCQFKIKKNHVKGNKGRITVPVYWSVGIDDIGSCVDYLIEEGHWKNSNGVINAREFEVKLKKNKLIKWIETEGEERDLRLLVAKVYKEIQDASAVKRKRRYS